VAARNPRTIVNTPAPAADGAQPDFAVGDVVVYASHGIGQVTSAGPDGPDGPTITLSFESGMTVRLPMARAVEALRHPADEAELADVERALRADEDAPAEPWARQHRRTREKLTSGRAADLAEVVRDGVRREQRRAASGGTTAPSDRDLYLRARALLTAEIALCRGIQPAAAEAWILEQVTAAPPGPARRR
jgi:CarD family transcriptional regulator